MKRFQETLKEHKVDHALLTSPGNICCFTGQAAAIGTGPSPFAPLAAALVCIRGEKPALFIADSEPLADAVTGLEIRKFQGYAYDHPLKALEDICHIKDTAGSHFLRVFLKPVLPVGGRAHLRRP